MPLQPSQPLQQTSRRIVLALALLALVASRAAGQLRFGPDPSRNDPTQLVYVPDSAKVVENLALAQRLERLKEWDKAADVYQELAEKYSDKVVALNDTAGAPADAGAEDDSKQTRRYASVSLRVQELLGKWPDEGLARYKARNESSAAAMLESAEIDDVAALSRVMQHYFPTDAAKAAGFRLIELYIENGEFPAAAWVGERMLAHHPGVTDADRPKLLFRTALAEHLGNDDAAAKRNADELTRRFANATGTWRGQDVVLSAELPKILSAPAAVAHGGTSADVWPTFGGDATRGRIPAASARPSARLPVDISTGRGISRNGAHGPIPAGDQGTEKSLRDQGAYLNILPAVDRGEIFFQDGQRLYAEGLESGLPLPGWSTYDDTPAAPQARPLAAMAAGNAIVNAASGAQFSVTLTDNSVLAVLRLVRQGRQPDPMGNMPQMVLTPLVCHDRATGAQRWSFTPSQLPQRPLRDLELGGSPLVVGDNVYIAARGGRAAETQNAYILCVGLRDGKFKWACYLSAASVSLANGMPGQAVASHLAYAGGRIYAVTNLGAVAAVDAYSGTIVWLTLYPHPPNFGAGNFMNAGGGVMTTSGKPWAQNPPIVKDGKVFALPSDSNALYIYDAGTGAEIKRISLSGQLDNANTLLGVVGEKVILNSLNKVFCINWTKFPDESPDYWDTTLIGPDAIDKEAKDTIRGRGFVTTDSVFIPTTSNLRRLALEGGKLQTPYPPQGSWAREQHEEPGNVLVTTDQVIVAGQDHINVYSDLGLAIAKLDREVQVTPSDPLPRLKYAETLFASAKNANETRGAVAKLDEGIQLLGGMSAMRPGALRDRVFARSMAFAERSANPTAGVPDLDLVNSLYDRAAAAASSPQQNVTYRLSRAKFVHNQHKSDAEQRKRDWAAEVRLNQEILSVPAWRNSLVSNSDENASYAGGSSSNAYGSNTGSATSARVIAERNIDDVLRQDQTRDSYAPYDQAAHKMLATAQAQNDPQAMLAVTEIYPNSSDARTAMLSAAGAFEDVKNYRQATRVLAEAYRKYHDDVDVRPRILEAQARNYLKLPGGMGVALGRLSEGHNLGDPRLTKPLILPDGDPIPADTSFSGAALILQGRVKREAQATLADFNLPRQIKIRANTGTKILPAFEPEAAETIISDCDQLLLPPRDLRERTRFDRLVTWTRDRGVSVYAVGGTAPLGTAAVGDNKTPPRGAIWFGNDLVVWTSDAVMSFKGDALAPGWRVAVAQMEVPDVVEADAAVMQNAPAVAAAGVEGEVPQPQLRPFQPRMLRLGAAQAGGIGGIVVGGAPVAQPGGGGAVGGHGGGMAEQVLFVRPVGDRAVFITNFARIAAIDVATGQLAWQTRIADSLSDRDQIASNDDFLAARYGTPEGARIIALDAYAGQIVFADSPGNDLPPQNLTLSSDGILVYTLPDRIRAKDLFEPGKTLKFPDTSINDPNANNGRPFEGAITPGQLVVSEGRILAVADRGQDVRVFSADSGQPMVLNSDNPPPMKSPLKLATGARSEAWNATICVVGTRLYIFQDRTPTTYNLDHPEEQLSYQPVRPDYAVVDEFVGKQHLVLITTLRPPDPVPGFKANTQFELLAYGRYPSRPDRNDESGKLDHAAPVPPVMYPTEITQWQPVEGGFYYCGADRRAHFLKGAGALATAASQPAKPAGAHP